MDSDLPALTRLHGRFLASTSSCTCPGHMLALSRRAQARAGVSVMHA
jgi:hypothetical protein